MFHILNEKIKRDEETAPSATLETLEKQLAQATTVIDLLFMKEISQLMTICSKSLQRFDVLPFEAIADIDALKTKIHIAKEAFENNKIPNVIDLNDYKLWDFFNSSIQNICENQKFQGVELLVAGDRGRVTRSDAKHSYDKDNFGALVRSRYPKYAKYLHDIFDSLKRRFEPWPQWLTNCNNAFNFQNGLVIQERKVSFDNLMDCKCGPNPLLPEGKDYLQNS